MGQSQYFFLGIWGSDWPRLVARVVKYEIQNYGIVLTHVSTPTEEANLKGSSKHSEEIEWNV